MKIKKTMISLLGAALIALSAAQAMPAQEQGEPVTTLLVKLHDGSVDKYRLSDTPEVTFDGDQMTVASTETTGTYTRSDVSHFEIRKEWYSAVGKRVATEEASFTFTYVDNANVIVTSNSLSIVEVFSAGGLKMTTVAAVNGSATISVADFSPGVYIIAPDCHQAVKIVKR